MRRLSDIMLLLILSYSIHFIAAGQDTTETVIILNPIKDDISERLPSLQSLIDSALLHSPAIKFRNIGISMKQKNVLTKKRDWTNNLGMDASIRYGSIDNVVLSQTSSETADPISTTVNTRYSAGVFVKLPLFDIVNRRNEIDMAKIEVEEAMQLKEQEAIEIRKAIISQYNDLILRQKLLRIYSTNKETSEIQLEMALNQFRDARITMSDLARVQESVTRALSLFETAKTEFIIAYFHLEEMLGIDLNIKYSFTK